MRFDSRIGYLEKLKLFYVRIPSEVLLQSKSKKDKSTINQRFRITLNNDISWLAGSVALHDGDAYITVSKSRMRKLNVDLGSMVLVKLEKDNSEFGIDVPEEFIELLNQDKEANRRFYSLTKGKQRATIYLVTQLKSSDKRIEKSLFLLNNIKNAPEKNTTMRHILGKE